MIRNSKFSLALIFLILASSPAFGGISFTEYLNRKGQKAQLKASKIALTLKVDKVVTTKKTRNHGYLKYDDGGPLMKTVQQQVLAHCRVLKVNKNSTPWKLKAGDTVVLTYWKHIKGKVSRNYRGPWQFPPQTGDQMLAIFLSGYFNAKQKSLRPTFIHLQMPGHFTLKYQATLESKTPAITRFYTLKPHPAKTDKYLLYWGKKNARTNKAIQERLEIVTLNQAKQIYQVVKQGRFFYLSDNYPAKGDYLEKLTVWAGKKKKSVTSRSAPRGFRQITQAVRNLAKQLSKQKTK